MNYANRIALIKIAASVYDMYPHETYALRHNSNNPAPKEMEILAVRESDDNVKYIKAQKDEGNKDVVMPKFVPSNSRSLSCYTGQYNILNDRPNIEGTGHGVALSQRPHNPQSYS